jgi:steroid 5-alpha reductase family enzyme
MPEIVALLLQNLGLLIVMMLVLWGVSIALSDVTFIDAFWALGFVLVAISTYATTTATTGPHKDVILVVTTIWGVRLGGYLTWRWRREGPDGRYLAMMKRASGNPHLTSLRKVFLFQALLLFGVSLPVQLGQIGAPPEALGLLAQIGIGLACIGIFFETVGDYQLARFRGDPMSKGRILDTGLWRFTRHPNYFGDLCVWWGLFLIAAETPTGVFSIFGPALLTWILLRYSGAVLLERRMHRSREGYAEYVARTSRIIPWPPSQ